VYFYEHTTSSGVSLFFSVFDARGFKRGMGFPSIREHEMHSSHGRRSVVRESWDKEREKEGCSCSAGF
jgi:hypothetical protein